MLDYSIQSPQQRKKIVEQILAQTPPEKITHYLLQKLSNYLILAMTKEQKKQKNINTENRLITINKRETSFEGLVSKFENGEDGIYNLISNNKNILLTPKVSISPQDLHNIPPLQDLHNSILKLQSQIKYTHGSRRAALTKQLIEMRRDQYIIKMAYKPVICINATKSFSSFVFSGKTYFKNNKIIDQSLISLFNPQHISALLCNYSKLKEQCYGKFYADGYYLMEDLDLLISQTLKEKYPAYFHLLIYKIDGLSNIEIQQKLYQQHHVKYSIQYISILWRKRIPKLIAETASKNFLEWYYTTQERGRWKKCNRCKKIKLAHSLFFSKNNSSKDGFYSICKECRNLRTQQLKNSSKILIIKRIPYKRKEAAQNG